MLRHPPEILITTPESLNLLLSSQGGQSMLRSVNTLILDEIHSIVSNKRGLFAPWIHVTRITYTGGVQT